MPGRNTGRIGMEWIMDLIKTVYVWILFPNYKEIKESKVKGEVTNGLSLAADGCHCS